MSKVDLITLALAKKYTDKSMEGGGAVAGKNCTVSSITPITGGNRVTFLWTLDDGTEQTDTMDVMDGQDGNDGNGIASVEKTGTSGLLDTYTITFTNGDTTTFTVTNGADGEDGEGVPTGGTAGQVLVKKSSTDYDTEWGTPAGGGDMLKSVYDTDNDGKVDSAENADTVDGHTVAKDVPADAVFTDTVYDDTELAGKVSAIEGVIPSDATTSNKLATEDDIPDVSNFITNTVNNLVNYYLKTETYTKTEVDNIATAIKNSRFEVVLTLPTTDIKTNVIYLVPKDPTQTSNVKDEYINLDGTTAGWEKIGDTEIDLSNYVTTQALNTALAAYTTTADLTTLLAAKQDTLTFDNVPTENSNNPVKSGGVFKAIDDAVKALDVTDVAVTGSYVTSVSETDGKIAVTRVEADSAPTQNSPKAVKSNGIYVANNTIYSVMGINGAKNLVDIPDFTLIKDTDRTKSVSIRALPKRPYICSFDVTDASDPINGQVQVFDINNYAVGGVTITENGHYSFPVSADHDDYRNIYAYINSTLADGTTMKISNFMIRLASDTDDTYEPYAKTNQELTADVSSLKKDLWDANSILGAKNLAPRLNLQTINNVTFDINDDGSITVNGTATSDCWYNICGQDINNFLQAGENYIVSGCPEGGSDATFFMYIGGSYSKYVLDDTSFTCDAAKSGNLYICVRTNTVMDNVVFYPMIRLASDTDSTYQPYAKTNQELTKDVNGLIGNELENGVVNLLPTPYTSIDASVNGITRKYNNDGSVTLSGTATASTSYEFKSRVTDNFVLPAGKYKIKCIVDGTYTGVVHQQIKKTVSGAGVDVVDSTLGNENEFTVDSNTGALTVQVIFSSGAAITNSITVFPMIYRSELSADKYYPYAKGNQELTKDVQPIPTMINDLGAKNVMPFILSDIKTYNNGGTWNGNSYTMNGVTFTLDLDEKGSLKDIVVDGTATAKSFFTLTNWADKTEFIGKILNGCTEGSTTTFAMITSYRDSNNQYITDKYQVDNDYVVEDVSGSAILKFMIFVMNGVTISNKKFYPMVRYASITDGAYEPYAKTNRQLTEDSVDWESNSVLGAKNFLTNKGTATTQGVEFAVDSNGVFTVTRKSAGSGHAYYSNGTFDLPAGTYIFSNGYDALPSGIQATYLYNRTDGAYFINCNNGPKTFTITEEKNLAFNIEVQSSQSPNGVKIYPMIRLVSDNDATYQPYAKTNRELTEAVDGMMMKVGRYTKTVKGTNTTYGALIDQICADMKTLIDGFADTNTKVIPMSITIDGLVTLFVRPDQYKKGDNFNIVAYCTSCDGTTFNTFYLRGLSGSGNSTIYRQDVTANSQAINDLTSTSFTGDKNISLIYDRYQII